MQHRAAGAARVRRRWRARPGWRSPAPCWRRCDRCSGSGGEFAAELDHIAIAVVPLVEQGEVVDDVVDVGGHACFRPLDDPAHTPYGVRDTAGRGRIGVRRVEFGSTRAVRRSVQRRSDRAVASRCGPRQAGMRSGATSVFCDGFDGGTGTALPAASTTVPVSLRPDMLVEELVEHLGAGLRPLPERDRDLRADHAGVALPVAELRDVGHRRGRGRDRLAGADVDLRRRLRPAARQAHQNDRQPECQSQKKSHDPAPNPLRPFCRLRPT